MKLTEEQIKFLDMVCCSRENWTLNKNGEVDVPGGTVNMTNMNLTEIPVKFGVIGGLLRISGNKLTDYFKSIKEEDFSHWENLDWFAILDEYPFLINTLKNYLDGDGLKDILDFHPLTKIYYRD
jgi:hypothetical protein